VWWDFEIEAGKRFVAAIDEALSKADAVVVLWSIASIESAWVQDEAAAGRDSGRLVPVLIGPVTPPLGFRQYQSIDLSNWSGRGAPKQLDRLLAAIAAIHPAPTMAPVEQPPARMSAAKTSRSLSPKTFAALGGVALLIALAVAALLWFRPGGASAAPSVTVEPGRTAPLQASTALAHDVAIDLARFQAGPLSGMSVAEPGAGATPASDYRVQVADTSSPSGEHADVSTLGKGNQLLWTTSIDDPAGRSTDLRQQVSAAIGAVLACAVRAGGNPRLSPDVVRLYLGGCSGIFNSVKEQINPTLERDFRQITVKAPDFAEGWRVSGCCRRGRSRTTIRVTSRLPFVPSRRRWRMRSV
jgi:hypothetical protein